MANLVESADLRTPKTESIEIMNSMQLPAEARIPAKFSRKDLVKKRIIHAGMKDEGVLNAFRDLRTSTLTKLSQFNSVIQVSAVRQRGGASFTALNLAVSCTFDFHRHALLVDCNFERPAMARTLNVQADLGLSDFLTEKASNVQDIIYPTAIPRISLVPRGQINEGDSIEFFTGERMRHFLEEVKNKHENRIIILDAPPVPESADAKILAGVVDSVLVVLPYNGTSSSKVQKILKAAGKGKVVGFVINN